jgi:hypothetical protein
MRKHPQYQQYLRQQYLRQREYLRQQYLRQREYLRQQYLRQREYHATAGVGSSYPIQERSNQRCSQMVYVSFLQLYS